MSTPSTPPPSSKPSSIGSSRPSSIGSTSPSMIGQPAPAPAAPPWPGPATTGNGAPTPPPPHAPAGQQPQEPGSGTERPGTPETTGAPGSRPAGPSRPSAADGLKSAAGDQLKERVPYGDKADQAKRVLDAGRQGGAAAGAEEAAAMGGAAAARAGATALTGGLSDAAGAVAPGVNKLIDKVGEAAGRAAFKGVAKVAAAAGSMLLVVVVLLTGSITSLVTTMSGTSGRPPAPTTAQCETMPQNWCDAAYQAQQSARGGAVPVPWTVLAAIARVTTDYGRTSPYDTVDRDASRPTPAYLAENFTATETTVAGASLGTIPYNSGSLAWGGFSNGQIPLDQLCTLAWDPTRRLECTAAAALTQLNEAFKARFGTDLIVSDGYRDLAGQVFQRNRWCGQGKCGNAAVPGTSNHGWAKAADLDDLGGYEGAKYLWLKANAATYGWTHPAFMEPGGRGPFEPWHWEFRGGDGTTTVATASSWAPAATGDGVSAGVLADGASSCEAATPSTPIGGVGRQAEGPFLLLPAAAQNLRDDGGDPQNPCDAAEFVADALSEATVDVVADLGKPNPNEPQEAAVFWQEVIKRADVIASPDETSGECVVTEADVPVDQLIERIWNCEISQIRELHVVSDAVTTADGSMSFSEYSRDTAATMLVAEAKSVAWSASQYGAAACAETDATAGVFPLTAGQAGTAGAVARCDVQANIRAAARIVLAAEEIPVADRSSEAGPFAPMLGGWAQIPAALGAGSSAFPVTGPRRPWVATDTCSDQVRTFVLAAAGTGSPFADLATATQAPADGSVYSAHLGAWPEAVVQACGTSSDADLSAHAATITLAEASSVPGVGVPRADGATPTDPAATATEPEQLPATAPLVIPEGVLLGGPGASVPGVVTPTADPLALLGLTNWLTWQAQAGAPAAAVYGTDSMISRLSTTGALPAAGPVSASTAGMAADPWQTRVTEWAVFYGGLVRPFDTHGERTGSLVSSLTGASGQFAALAGDSSMQAQAVIAAAKRYLGTPYSWGGGGPNGPGSGSTGLVGFDCSGLTEYAFAQAGYQIGTFTGEQQTKGTTVDGLANAQPGDLLFFNSPISHVAIYLGDNQLIHAPKPGDVVKISSVYETPTLIKRVIEPRAAATGGLDQWVSTALGVLYANGFPQGADDTAALKLIIDHESSGNPAAVNRTDSNAQAGHPSFGLMQTIPTTFDAHALPGYTDKSDPVAQIIAGARYAQSRYGGLDNVPGVKSVRSGGAYVGY